MVIASGGLRLPSFEKLTTFKTWAEEGPPKARSTITRTRTTTRALGRRGTCAHKIAEQIYNQASATQWLSGYYKGRGHGQDARLGAKEIEGFMRTKARPRNRRGAAFGWRRRPDAQRPATSGATNGRHRHQRIDHHQCRWPQQLHKLMQAQIDHRFLMTLPLILLILVLVAYRQAMRVPGDAQQGHDAVCRPGNFEFLFDATHSDGRLPVMPVCHHAVIFKASSAHVRCPICRATVDHSRRAANGAATSSISHRRANMRSPWLGMFALTQWRKHRADGPP